MCRIGSKRERGILEHHQTEVAVELAEGPVHSKPFQVVESDLHQEDGKDKGNVAEEEDQDSVDLQGLEILVNLVISLLVFSKRFQLITNRFPVAFIRTCISFLI